ncbi:hypothetical protein GCM10009819_29510 [Agromyces tropicus]|uniref:Uncharacterized protein n=1 Tax=Agromyces tropicus TaxID=555371 RepID=A0ABP5G7Z1_9MICO
MNLLEKVSGSGWADGIVIGDDARALLEALEDAGTPDRRATLATVAIVPGALGAQLPAGAAISWTLARAGAGFRMTLTFAGTTSLPFPDVQAATRTDVGTGVRRRARLSPAGPLTAALTGDVVIEGRPHKMATIAAPALGLAPSSPHLLLPSGIGLSVPSPLRLSARNALEVVLPDALPLLGGLVVPADLAFDGGAIEAEVPVRLRDPDPTVDGALAWRTGPDADLRDLVPVSVSLALTLPDGPLGPLPTGDPRIRLRVQASRPVEAPAALRLAVGVDSDAPEGIVHVPHAPSAKVPGAVVALAPGVLAETGGAAASVAALLAGAAFAQAVTTAGGYTVHSADIEAATADGRLSLRLDVSGSVSIAPWAVSTFLKISMDAARPMRVRWREVRATIDPSRTGAEAVRLDFADARAEILDPGGWRVETAQNLFEIIGTRSGSGSTWFEVDLRFTYDLGPVRVRGATVRATWDGGTVRYGMRGLEASIEVPGLVSAGGAVSLVDGIEVVLWAELIPLGASGFLVFRTATEGGVTRYEFALGVDLPVPIPLGPTGLSLYTVAATFGSNSAMPALDPADPLLALRKWQPWDALVTREGELTLGAGVVVGTGPDAGFAFNALGSFGIQLPDAALRIALDARFLHARQKASDLPRLREHADGVDAGLQLFGGLAVSGSEVVVGVLGRYDIPHVLSIRVPVVGRFPFGSSAWFLHAGSDQVGGRTPAPLSATVFPGLDPLQVEGHGFVMIDGGGIPNVAGTGTDLGGFAVAVGAGFTKTYGVRPVLWAEVSAEFVAGIGTRPFMLWVTAKLRGGAGIGPFSVGVDTTITIQIGPDTRVDVAFSICVSIDLWLTTLRGCIEIGTLDSDPADAPVPADDDWPFPTSALADGIGRIHVEGVATAEPPVASTNPAPPDWKAVPTVWPDAIPLLSFPIAPVVEAPGVPLPGGTQNGGITGSGTYRFRWVLADLALERIGDDGAVAASVPLGNSAWQAAPEDVAVTSGLRQLALLTTSRGVSLIHQSPRYTGLDRHPMRGVAGLCGWDPVLARAWSFGIDAVPDGSGGWHVPGGYGEFAPLSLAQFSRPIGFTTDWRIELLGEFGEIPALMAPSGPYRFDRALEVEDAAMAGALATGAPAETAPWHPDQPELLQTLTVTFDEPVADGALYLLARAPSSDLVEGAHPADARVDGGIQPVPPEVIDRFGDDGDRFVVRFDLPFGSSTLTWTPPWQVAADVLGLHAIAVTVADLATTARSSTRGIVDRDRQDADAPWNTRTMLKAGSNYRIRVTLRWERLHDGEAVAFVPPDVARTVHWFFRTAPPRPVADHAADAPWKDLRSPVSAVAVALGRKTFDLSSVQRYFDRYSVADGASHVFTTDVPEARFFAVHVAQLADVYGRRPVLVLRRTDRPRAADDPPGPTMLAHGAKIAGSLGMLVAEAAHGLGCTVPPPGITLRWPGGLERNASYELSVAFANGVEPVRSGDPELAGVTFSTSSFTGPEELMRSFGFVTVSQAAAVAAAHSTGDLPAPGGPPGGPTVLTGDAAFEDALDGLGVDPGGAGIASRSTVLWCRLDEGWAVRGLLLESAEPLIRDGGRRMALQGARVGGTELPIRRFNRTGTRALWLTADPVVPAGPSVIAVDATEPGTAITSRLTVPPAPRFTSALMAEAVRA